MGGRRKNAKMASWEVVRYAEEDLLIHVETLEGAIFQETNDGWQSI